MNLLLALGILFFAGVGGVVGVRLLALARRTRGAPEALAGAGLLAYAVICQPLLLGGGLVWDSLGAAGKTALLGAIVASATLSLGCLLAFSWRVFRPEATWARGLVALGVVASAVSGTYTTVTLEESAAASLVSTGVFVVAFAWAGVESLRYYGLLRKRARLGLADPVVQNRFLVWGVTLSLAALLAVFTSLLAGAGLHVGSHPGATALALVSTCANAVGWWLSFLPPEAYRRAIRARAESSSA